MTVAQIIPEFDVILDRLANDGWTCGWHTVTMEDGSQFVVIEGSRKEVTIKWRYANEPVGSK